MKTATKMFVSVLAAGAVNAAIARVEAVNVVIARDGTAPITSPAYAWYPGNMYGQALANLQAQQKAEAAKYPTRAASSRYEEWAAIKSPPRKQTDKDSDWIAGLILGGAGVLAAFKLVTKNRQHHKKLNARQPKLVI